MKAIKELENQLNVSSVSLYRMVKKPEFSNHVFKDINNKTIIDEIGVEMLKAHYLKGKDETIQDLADNEINTIKADFKPKEEVKNADIITLLSEQLKEKDNQINLLLNIVSNQQKIEGAKLIADQSQQLQTAENQDNLKGSWFKRMFKRK